MNEKVVHHKVAPEGPRDVYIGRPGPWGNPFVIGVHGTRDDVLELFDSWLRAKNFDPPVQDLWTLELRRKFAWMREHIGELEGRVLRCWCHPLPCHGDVLVKYLNEELNDDDQG